MKKPAGKKPPAAKPLSLGEKLLAAAPTPLPIGLQILKVAYAERGSGFVVQNRQDERLFKFFDKGVGWSKENWKAQFSKGPHWCAAFVSYCYKTAYANAEQPLPLGFKGAAAVSVMREIFKDHFVSTAAAFENNLIRPDIKAQLNPGDIVVTEGHVALLTGFTEGVSLPGKTPVTVINTIEGNTCIWEDGDSSKERWGIFPREHRVNKIKLIGFLRATSAPPLQIAQS